MTTRRSGKKQAPNPEIFEEKLRLAEEKLELQKERIAHAAERARTAEERLAHLQERLAQADERSQASTGRIRQELQDARLHAQQLTLELHRLEQKLRQTEERAEQAEEQLRQLSFRDQLTGLPNLRQFQEYLELTLDQVRRYRRTAALLLVDLDRFKVINHAVGMEAGDRLLVDVARRLEESARESDRVGRRGEDEFLVLLTDLSGGREPSQAAEAAARRLLNALSQPFTIQGQPLNLHATVGISLIPGDAENSAEALQHADNALYYAKELGGARYALYREELGRHQARRLTSGRELERALEAGEFFLEYQPIVRFNRARTMGILDPQKFQATLVGFEALMRWEHRIEGVVGPEYFLRVAEETGLIIPLRRWMIREACLHFKRWREKGLCVLLSMDLSPRQLLLQKDLVSVMVEEARRVGLKTRSLIVDIAEDFHREGAEFVEEMLREISEAGIGIAIDDFGTRLGSLARLHSKYTQIVKIAPDLVNRCTESNACLAAINLARSLELVPLAKGISTAEQARFLARNGCAMAQGNFFAAPVEAEAVLEMVRKRSTWKF
ncbi:MAG: EAL domain-containing protein [Armatimonadetes bacterium]|nr:EAL domain-containing protein [Armatimonadota bacterium]